MKKKWVKFLLLGLFLLLVLVFWRSGAAGWLTLARLQSGADYLVRLRQQSPWLFALAFALIYVVVTACSLPGAAVLSLAGGALFGLIAGTALVSIASTVGATLAMLSARFLLRGWVESHWGPRLQNLRTRLQQEGAWVLFSLRLVPLVPFFLLNLAAGLTQLPVRTFFWVSQVGMLAGTLVYVNAGTQLASIQNLSDIISARLWLSLALLAGLPWLLRPLLKALQKRRALLRWRRQRPKHFDRNLIVIGGGAAGLVSSYIAAALKAKVTLVEAKELGGDCLYSGCVPSKALIRCAADAHRARQAAGYGIKIETVKIDWAAVMRRVRAAVAAIQPHDSIERYTALGVEVLSGQAVLESPWQVRVTAADGSSQTLTTRAVVLANGAMPTVPQLDGLEEVGYVTSDTIWELLASVEALPQRIVVLGGGPIGCELGQALARLGARVTIVQRGQRLLMREDREVGDHIVKVLAADGVQIFLNRRPLRAQVLDGQKTLLISGEEDPHRLDFDLLVVAVGRKPRCSGHGLEALGLDPGQPISSNQYLQTLCPTVFIAGDAAGYQPFTHAAAHQAWHATVNALFGTKIALDQRLMPAVTFTAPEVARVGLNEQEAQAQGLAYEVTHFQLADLDRALTEGEEQGWLKVLTQPGRDRLLGATCVGAHAGENLAGFCLAMRNRLGLGAILRTVFPYPTWAEANKSVAGRWRQTHTPERLLWILKHFHNWRRR